MHFPFPVVLYFVAISLVCSSRLVLRPQANTSSVTLLFGWMDGWDGGEPSLVRTRVRVIRTGLGKAGRPCNNIARRGRIYTLRAGHKASSEKIASFRFSSLRFICSPAPSIPSCPFSSHDFASASVPSASLPAFALQFPFASLHSNSSPFISLHAPSFPHACPFIAFHFPFIPVMSFHSPQLPFMSPFPFISLQFSFSFPSVCSVSLCKSFPLAASYFPCICLHSLHCPSPAFASQPLRFTLRACLASSTSSGTMLAHPTPCPYIFFHSSRSLVHPFSIHVPTIAHFCHPCSISFPSSVHPFSTHASPSTCSTHCPSVFDECLSFSTSFHPFPPTSPFPSRRIIRINVRHDADYAGAAGDAVHYGHPPKSVGFGLCDKNRQQSAEQIRKPFAKSFQLKRS